MSLQKAKELKPECNKITPEYNKTDLYMYLHTIDVALSKIYSVCFQNTRIPNDFKIDS